MTTSTRTHPCVLCGKPGASHTPDGLNFFCVDPTPCLDRVQSHLEQTDYRDATPEMYELFKAREAQAKEYWYKCVNDSERLRAVLGLDDTTFLTHLEELERIGKD